MRPTVDFGGRQKELQNLRHVTLTSAIPTWKIRVKIATSPHCNHSENEHFYKFAKLDLK